MYVFCNIEILFVVIYFREIYVYVYKGINLLEYCLLL